MNLITLSQEEAADLAYFIELTFTNHIVQMEEIFEPISLDSLFNILNIYKKCSNIDSKSDNKSNEPCCYCNNTSCNGCDGTCDACRATVKDIPYEY